MATSFPGRFAAYACLLAVLTALSACQTVEKPVATPLDREILPPDFLIRRLLERQTGMNDLKSFVRTTIQGKNGRHSFRQAILLREGDSIRIDTFGVLRQTLGVFIHDKEETLFYDAGKNRILYGQKVWAVLSDSLGTRLDFRKNISVFFGHIPRLENLRLIEARWGPENKTYQLKTRDPMENREVEIEIDPTTLLPARMTVTSPDPGTIIVEWQDYRKVGDLDFPHLLVLALPDRGEKVTVKYSQPQINAGIPEAAFRLFLSGSNQSAVRF